jgi:acetylornithine deacetylase
MACRAMSESVSDSMDEGGDRPSSRELFENLIGFNTVSRESSLEMIAFIGDYLKQSGIQSEPFHNAVRT